MTTTDEFRAAVSHAAQGTPYVVTPTEGGFDVTLNIADAQWYGLFNKAGLTKVVTHHVSLEGDRYEILDDSRELRWVAGVPSLHGSYVRQTGRVREFGFEKSWAFDEDGRFRKVVDYSFSTGEGLALIRGVAEQLGLTERQPASVKVAIGLAVFTLIALLVGGLAVAAYLLLS